MFELIDKNKRITAVVVVLFVLLLGAFISAFGYIYQVDLYFMVPLAAIISIFSSVMSYYYSDKIVLGISRARPASDEEHKYVVSSLEGLCIAAGLSTVPRLYIIDDTAPNAFATGRNPENSVICLTTGILQKLDANELEGVLAHELAHIRNYDILLSTIVTVMVGMIALISDWFTRSTLRRSRGRSRSKNKDSHPILLIIALVMMIIAPIAAQLMKFALSRNREYLADATAIEFTRNPEGLINALQKISADNEPLEAANKATANMYIINPFKGDVEVSWLDKLYSTHPPINERVEALKNIY